MTTTQKPPEAPARGLEQKGLRAGVLGFPAMLAQSVALISPTMTAALIVPLAFAAAGNGAWIAYLFAMIMLSFVVMQLNQFARRSGGSGSMYAYIGRGLGPRGGVVSGWTLLWCYAFIAIAGLTGFLIFLNQFLDSIGIHHNVPSVWCYAATAIVGLYVAYRDVRVSSLLMLALEGISIVVILALSLIVLFGHGNPVDTDQLTLKGMGANDLNLAVVVCIFSLVGFESATALGGEARNPLRTVPRAVSWSLAITGVFFVFVTYMEVLGTRNSSTPLSALTAPLNTLAEANHVSFLKVPISLGAMFSFFSLSLSCINAGSRILYPMAAHGVFPRVIGTTHYRNRTPHVAISLFALVVFLIPAIMLSFTDPLSTFGYAGSLAAYGFLLEYFLVTVAALVFLRRRGELQPKNKIVFVLAVACMIVPTIGSFYPVPAAPGCYFPYYFLAYLLLGGVWLATVCRHRPAVLTEIEQDLETTMDADDHRSPATAPSEAIVPSPATASRPRYVRRLQASLQADHVVDPWSTTAPTDPPTGFSTAKV